MKLFLMPGKASTARYISSNFEWSVFRFGQICGWMHDGRLHFSQALRLRPCMPYILADGPPKSLRLPLKSGISITCFTSRRILSFERQEINLPWWAFTMFLKSSEYSISLFFEAKIWVQYATWLHIRRNYS